MRLLNTTTLEFFDFLGDACPPYAILSHTWGDEELTYQDMLVPKESIARQMVRAKAGYAKLTGFIHISKTMKYSWCWCDTVSIDKTSSAELTEAINSMYRWYEQSAVCIVYLNDCQYTETPKRSPWKCSFGVAESKWFTRGWTLQELVAPKKLEFFDRGWRTLHVLPRHLAEITAIPEKVIRSGVTDDVSVAQIMCWAANRQTTRPEDMAYCLLGLVEVNMPLLYGEGGQRAFLRLQEEIIRRSSDQTIFLWSSTRTHNSAYRGVLARHPSEYAGCAGAAQHYDMPVETLPYSLTNTGLQTSLVIFPLSDVRKLLVDPRTMLPIELPTSQDLYIPVLHCSFQNRPHYVETVILKNLSKNGQRFARVFPWVTVGLDLTLVLTSRNQTTWPLSKRPHSTNLHEYIWPQSTQVSIYQTLRPSDLYRTQPITGLVIDLQDGLEFVPKDDLDISLPTLLEQMPKVDHWYEDILNMVDTVTGKTAITCIQFPFEMKNAATIARCYLKIGVEENVAGVRTPNSFWYHAFCHSSQFSFDEHRRGGTGRDNREPVKLSSLVIHQDRFVGRVTVTRDMLPEDMDLLFG